MQHNSGWSQPWQHGLLGRALIAAEAQLLATTFDDVFGQELLQLGTWGDGRELLSHSRIRRQSVVAEPNRAPNSGDLVANLAHLPITNACVDAVLLPHTLEYAADPYAVLREADRILVAEGQLIVLGFRPLSFWGLRSAASRGYPSGLRRHLSCNRVRDWLGLLSYEIVTERPYLYHLPREPRGPVEAVVPHMLHRGWTFPWPSGAYLIKARKRVYTLTPIRPRLRERVKVLGGLVEPSM